ncbi:hypothetical protein GCM10027265_19650 [Jatrophihabitans fulvus]
MVNLAFELSTDDDSRPPLRRGPVIGASVLAFLGAYAALLLFAAVPLRWWTVAAAAAVLVGEVVIDRRLPAAVWLLAQLQLGLAVRAVLRGVAVVLLAVRLGYNGVTAVVVATVMVVVLGNAVTAAMAQLLGYLRRPPVLATGLPLRLGDVPGAPPTAFTGRAAAAPLVEVIAAASVVAADVSSAGSDRVLAVTGLLVAAVLALVPAVVSTFHTLRLLRTRPRERVPAAIARELERLRPTTVVYFGDGPEWQYQLEQWLPVLERLDRPVIALVREREVLRTLPPTTVPVVCVPLAATLLGMPLPWLRASLFVGNNASNLHLLRRPELRSSFIGHGDSDKGASSNPFSRVYNEIWVAGEAGRLRYRAAGVDVPDDAFVDVGRPQLAEIPRVADDEPMLTVLYAPTWEGWGESSDHSSVPTVGPALVRDLLARPGVRVMYRPHPRIGHLDRATRQAHGEIVQLLRAAGAGPSAPPKPSRGSTADALERTLQWPASDRGYRVALDRWQDDFWRQRPRHRVLTEPAPDLYDCFRHCDVLISDVSSVTSDFLAADRPYAVVNVLDESDAAFRTRAGVAAGGFVLRPDLSTLDDVLAAARGEDPTATARAVTRDRLVSCYGDEALARFRAAVDRLVARD